MHFLIVVLHFLIGAVTILHKQLINIFIFEFYQLRANYFNEYKIHSCKTLLLFNLKYDQIDIQILTVLHFLLGAAFNLKKKEKKN